jgi:hypothetical protein
MDESASKAVIVNDCRTKRNFSDVKFSLKPAKISLSSFHSIHDPMDQWSLKLS